MDITKVFDEMGHNSKHLNIIKTYMIGKCIGIKYNHKKDNTNIVDISIKFIKNKLIYKNILYQNKFSNIVLVAVEKGIIPIYNIAKDLTIKTTLIYFKDKDIIKKELSNLDINIIYYDAKSKNFSTIHNYIDRNSVVITCGDKELSLLKFNSLYYHLDTDNTNINTDIVEGGKRKLLYNKVGYFDNFGIRNCALISGILILINWNLVTWKLLLISFIFSQIMFIIHNVSHHRELSHRSFKFTNNIVSNMFSLIGSMVTFKSGAWYAIHHRKHHIICDDKEEIDPYGGLYSGIDYSLRWFPNEIDFNKHHDYTKYPEFNTPFHLFHAKIENYIFPFWIGIIILFSTQTIFNLLAYCFIPILMNIFYIFLQTIPHLYPNKLPKHGKCHPSNPLICGLLTSGEGYHGHHHDHPRSSKIGRHWYQIDTGYLLIRLLEKIGSVTNVIVE